MLFAARQPRWELVISWGYKALSMQLPDVIGRYEDKTTGHFPVYIKGTIVVFFQVVGTSPGTSGITSNNLEAHHVH